VNKEYSSQIEALLTEEQRAEWRKIKDESRARAREAIQARR
jgi:hypothetical protein